VTCGIGKQLRLLPALRGCWRHLPGRRRPALRLTCNRREGFRAHMAPLVRRALPRRHRQTCLVSSRRMPSGQQRTRQAGWCRSHRLVGRAWLSRRLRLSRHPGEHQLPRSQVRLAGRRPPLLPGRRRRRPEPASRRMRMRRAPRLAQRSERPQVCRTTACREAGLCRPGLTVSSTAARRRVNGGESIYRLRSLSTAVAMRSASSYSLSPLCAFCCSSATSSRVLCFRWRGSAKPLSSVDSSSSRIASLR